MKLKSKLFYFYIVLLVIYSGFTLLPKPLAASLKQYHLSTTGLRLLDLTIVVLLAGIWFVGFYAYGKLNAYIGLIKDYKDGQRMSKISQGLFWLVIWLPVSMTVSAVLKYFAIRHIKLIPAVTIINNYLNLILPLAAFILIRLGVRELSQQVKLRPKYSTTQILIIFLIYVSLTYAHLVVTTPGRALIYHMSVWLIILTIVAPYIYMWLTGLCATYQLYLYQYKVKGIVYRKGLSLLALGLGWLIVTSIGLQYLTTLSAHLKNLSIYGILAVLYVLLLVLAVGFTLVALGARKLSLLEEV